MALRVGVIGVGYLGRHHARIFSSLEQTVLAGIADIDAARAGEIAGQYGCRVFGSHTDLLRECDAVSIVTPTTTHAAIARDCIRAGKDLFIEKPITDSPDDARELIALAQRKNLVLQVGHIERYNPAVAAVSEIVRNPKFIEAERLSPMLGRGTDVDVTVDLMIHDIDIVLSLVRSKIREIRATGDSIMTGKIDVAKAWIEFDNGCKALITASRLAPEKSRRLRVHQDDAYISVDYQSQEIRKYVKAGGEITFDVFKAGQKEPLMEELRDFSTCVIERRRPTVSGEEALAALETVIAINGLIRGDRQ
ncbi:MAG: Gfo/Idh/MocA family oxidoreductase [Thermodesulfovibrionales bacterium]